MHIDAVELNGHAAGWFTGRDPAAPQPPIGERDNLSHRRPHRPGDLAEARAELAAVSRTDVRHWHLMRQVHGRAVGVVTDRTPPGAEFADVDALVTAEAHRALVVLAADCVPVLLAGDGVAGVAHAGRVGLASGVISATLDAAAGLGAVPERLVAVIGPAIGGCCYEVPAQLRDEVAGPRPAAYARSSWGTPSLDLPAAVRAELDGAGVRQIVDVGVCTRCDPRWFSHRRDPAAGRHAGMVVLDPAGAPTAVGVSDRQEGT